MRWTGGCVLVLALEFGERRKRRGKSEEDGGWDSEEEQQDVALGLLLACMKGGRRGQKGYFVCTSQVCCGPHDHVHMAQPERVSGKFANSCGPQMAIWRSF